MSSEFIAVPEPRPLVPPRPVLDILRDYWFQHGARAGETPDGREFPVACDCVLCLEAAQLLGVGR